MKTAGILTIVLFALAITFSFAEVGKAAPLGTAFTYQGRLLDDNAAADGLYDFQFKLYDDPNILIAQQIGSVVYVHNEEIIDGYFTVELDFGSSVFGGNAVWLEIGVLQRSIEYDPFLYTLLRPLQKLTPTPYALYAKNAGTDNDWMLSGNDIYSIPSGNVGIGTSTPSYRLHIVDTTLDSDAPAIYGEHAVTDYWGIGVQGIGLFKGVDGSVSATGPSSYYGVFGSASTSNTGGATFGVYGSGSGGAASYGVYGNGSSFGVSGYSGNGIGVEGSSNFSYGVYGKNSSNDNFGYLGDRDYGVYGKNNTSGNFGYIGDSSHGVFGSGSGSEEYGVFGENRSSRRQGYIGGYDYGVYGESYPIGSGYFFGYLGGGYGAYGEHRTSGKYGYLGGYNYGVYGEYNSSSYGYLGGGTYGVYGRNDYTNGYAVYGSNSGRNTSGYLAGTYGVYGQSNSSFAGYFAGNVYVSGWLSAGDLYDRTPYPKDLATAYQAVMSMERLGDGHYMENDKEMQLDHSTLSDFIRGEDGHRNLSATVSCQNEVLKDLIRKQNQLGKEKEMIKLLKQQVEVLQKDKEKVKLLEAENKKMKSRLAVIESMLAGSAASLKGAVQ